jgi:nitrite reductase/ring-hydroxylating ferredoxin subunit
VCSVDDVPPGEVKRFEVDGLPDVAVFNVEGRIYVTADCCTHMEASLAEGTVEGDEVECPFHGGRFHIPTGAVVCRPPVRPLVSYEVSIADDTVLIR